ncbi:MAG: hypothetical protein QOF76_908 [Solirubrobacteraceae bacterium]|nr:hypothetical protein [Solirubrobacteraceae bacterium]
MERLRTEDILAGLFGLTLAVSLVLPWYSVLGADVKATEAFGWIDIWLLLTALLGINVAVITGASDRPALPIAIDVLATWAGGIAILLVLFRILDAPGPDGVAREYGLWVGTAATLGLTISAWRAMRNPAAPGLAPNPEPERMPAPPC